MTRPRRQDMSTPPALLGLVQALARAAALAEYRRLNGMSNQQGSDDEGGDLRQVLIQQAN